jgi:hypothetical protein
MKAALRDWAVASPAVITNTVNSNVFERISQAPAKLGAFRVPHGNI